MSRSSGRHRSPTGDRRNATGPTDFLASLRSRARAAPRRVGFPEWDDVRVADAMGRLAREGLAIPVAVGPAESVDRLRSEREGLEAVSVEEAEDLVADRLPEETGHDRDDWLTWSGALLAAGRLDGVVAGARTPTARVVRVALKIVGLADGMRTLSSSFFLSGMARDPSGAGVLSFTDAGVVPDPDAEQLADIAVAACGLRRRVVGDEPRVAFLSYSTRGSAGGSSVEKVREALARFRERMPDVSSDGELQADAALVRDVGERKAPDSEVAGRANVLVFPDLDAANIAYKLVQRLAGAHALGPILQGVRRPINDLSRGAEMDEIVHVACITALMYGGLGDGDGPGGGRPSSAGGPGA